MLEQRSYTRVLPVAAAGWLLIIRKGMLQCPNSDLLDAISVHWGRGSKGDSAVNWVARAGQAFRGA